MSNKKIGLTCGCFDIIHHGHTTNLKTSRKYCDFLAVCLSSDKQIKRLKGEKRPINSISDRISMLVNFDFVDLVILYDETNDEFETELDNIMNIINPDIWFKGSDYTKDDILRKHPSLRKIKLIDIIPGKSTTNIIHRINN
jgi:D-beta-D-heptose 7-phosphate kinase/D-beta-D-heptose 1-phosphate adenosyltransferase